MNNSVKILDKRYINFNNNTPISNPGNINVKFKFIEIEYFNHYFLEIIYNKSDIII